jgi:mannose-1-phosphate guanylyltransferase/mannose-6-phosphate isomerase-like protein (cupin superfamily)
MSKKLRPIILAGGAGKRLWPLSTEYNPKQFIPIFKDLSLFDLTLQRVNNSLFKKPIVVTSQKYLKQVSKAFERTGLKPSLIVLEPESKNTYSAITLAALLSNEELGKDKLIIMPSDHYISNNMNFYQACKNALKGDNEALYLLGIKPEYNTSEYGYISFDEGSTKKIEFIEKPNTKKVQELLANNKVYWNSGIFIFGKSWFINKSRKSDPVFFKKIEASIKEGRQKGNLFYPEDISFSSITPISFDYGFVEKCKDISMIKLDAGWSDLGSWVSLMSLDSNQAPSFYGKELSSRIERPWGFYQVLMETDTSKVKLIRVMSHQKLSLQKHQYRSEKWFVVQGRAKVTRENEKFTLEIGDSINIEKKQVHSIENTESSPLEIIEIQTGDYLGEDDIVRLKDIYGRADLH